MTGRREAGWICRLVVGMALVFMLPAGVIRSADHGADDSAHTTEHATHGGDSAADASHGDSHDEHGDTGIRGDLALWSLVAFIVFAIAIKVLGLWDLLISSMSEREAAEYQAIEQAEAHLKEAESLLRESQGRMEALDETIRQILEEAQRDANYTRDEIIRTAQREAELLLDRAHHEIRRSQEQAVHDLFAHMAEKVTDTVEERLRTNLNTDDHNRLIDEMLSQLAAG